MVISIKDVELISASEDESDGEFRAEIRHQIVIGGLGNTDKILYLPSRVAALVTPRMSLVGDHYPDKPLVRCVGVHADTTDDPAVYTYDTVWSDRNSSPDGAGTRFNPLNDPPEILPVAGELTTTMTRDREDAAILNTAGDPLLVERTDNILGFKIKQNVPAIPPYLSSVVNSVNDSTFSVYGLAVPPEVARFWLPTDWWSLPKSRNNIDYFEFRFELHLDYRDGHKAWPMNAGLFQLVDFSPSADGSDKRRLEIRELGDGSAVSSPVPLDLDGVRLFNPTPEEVFFRETGRYLKASFLDLPGVVAA